MYVILLVLACFIQVTLSQSMCHCVTGNITPLWRSPCGPSTGVARKGQCFPVRMGTRSCTRSGSGIRNEFVGFRFRSKTVWADRNLIKTQRCPGFSSKISSARRKPSTPKRTGYIPRAKKSTTFVQFQFRGLSAWAARKDLTKQRCRGSRDRRDCYCFKSSGTDIKTAPCGLEIAKSRRGQCFQVKAGVKRCSITRNRFSFMGFKLGRR